MEKVIVLLTYSKLIKIIFELISKNVLPFLYSKKLINNIGKKEGIKNILIIEGGGIGDLLRTFPAIETIMDNFPKALFTLLISPRTVDLLSFFPRKQPSFEVMYYAPSSIKHQGLFAKWRLISTLRKRRFDLVYLPKRGQGMVEESLMWLLIGAQLRIGFYKDWVGQCNNIKTELKFDTPLLQQNIELLRVGGLNITTDEITLAKPPLSTYSNLIDKIRANKNPIISVHPGTLWATSQRRWPTDNFTLLIKMLIDKLHATILLLGSPDEQHLSVTIESGVNHKNLFNMAGKTTFLELYYLLSSSSIFIGGDSGPLHLALALKIPSVAIFGSTSPVQVIGSHQHVYVIKKDLPCSPCYVHQYETLPVCKHARCLSEITVTEVFNAVEVLLTNEY